MYSPFAAIGCWYRNWKAARANLARLDCCGAVEASRIAREVGLSVHELRALAGRWPDAAEPLTQRLAALELDQRTIARRDPSVLQDLQRVCALCGERRQCERDQIMQPFTSAWRAYCPNTTTLDALVAERKRNGRVN